MDGCIADEVASYSVLAAILIEKLKRYQIEGNLKFYILIKRRSLTYTVY